MNEVSVKQEISEDLSERLLDSCRKREDGVSRDMILKEMPHVDLSQIVQCINKLLTKNKLELLRSQSGELVYKATSSSKQIRGDQEEKIVHKIIANAENKGIWLRDIRFKSGLGQTQLYKVLKSLESKQLIKSVKCVNATKKRVYMLSELEPDRSVTGGTWYSDNDFEAEFVEVLNQQCLRYLEEKLENSKKLLGGPLTVMTASTARLEEIMSFLSNLNISKVSLKLDDVQAIMNTLILDGKVKMCETGDNGKAFRVVKPPISMAGFSRSPCGVCPVIQNCGERGAVRPSNCQYFNKWLQF